MTQSSTTSTADCPSPKSGTSGVSFDGRPHFLCPTTPLPGRDKSAVLVPYVDRIETECERGLMTLEVAGVLVVRKPGCSAIDVARSRAGLRDTA